jgi:cellulose synthase-like protein
LPCDCEFKICIDCFNDSVKSGALCPGCRELYKNISWEDVISASDGALSIIKSSNNNQSGEFDHNQWLYETKGTYGYGNAIWTDENGEDDDGNIPTGHPKELVAKPWRPLTRKLKVPAGVISPYRYTNSNFFPFDLTKVTQQLALKVWNWTL